MIARSTERAGAGGFNASIGRVLSLLVLMVLAVLVSITNHQLATSAQEDRHVVWERIDVVVALQEDSSFHVSERDTVRFEGGPFQEGYRDIPLTRIEQIDNIRVEEVVATTRLPYRNVSPDSFSRAIPNTYSFERIGTNLHIRWSFPPTRSQDRTFQIDYNAHGALRVYDDAPVPYQQISWAGVDRAVTQNAPVNAASLTFILPRPVDPDEAVVDGPGGDLPRDHTEDGQAWTWSAHTLRSGASLEATLLFPPLVSASKPAWQDASDRREQLIRERSPQLNLLFLGLTLLITVGGGLAVLAAWWTKGRDPEIGPVPDVIVTPPADLPPAVVGALVDEQVDERDIVATLVDLGRRGVLRIDRPSVRSSGSPEDFTLTLLQEAPHLSPFEQALLETLFGGSVMLYRQAMLSDMKLRFDEAGSRLQQVLYDELAQRGFFPTRPSRTRIFWKSAGVVLMIVAIVSVWLGISTLYDIAPTVWMPGAALLVLGVLVWVVARYMPRKTQAGAEAAATWRAFKRYLETIERYEQLDEAQDLFDRYLPYAIAFGLEKSWITTFSRGSTPAPRWYGAQNWPVYVPRGGAQPGSVGGAAGHSWTAPSLQGLSNQVGQSLLASSTSLFDLFNTAGQTFSGGALPSSGGAALQGGSGFSGSLRGVGLALTVFKAASGGGGGGFS